MTSLWRLLLWTSVGLLATCLLTPVAFGLAGLLGFELEPDRLWRRLALIFFILAVLRVSREGTSEVGLRPLRGGAHEVSTGFVLALAALLIAVGFLFLTGNVFFDVDFRWEKHGPRILTYLFAALLIGVLEEWTFRGKLFQAFKRDAGPLYALLAVSLLYSAVHFLQPTDELATLSNSPLLGFEIAAGMFHGFVEPDFLPRFFGLFLLGVLLAVARIRTGRLYLSIGFHAGLVYFVRLDGRFLGWNKEAASWWTGGKDFLDGPLSWALMAFSVGVVVFLTRQDADRTSAPRERDRLVAGPGSGKVA